MSKMDTLDHETLDLVLDSTDLSSQVTSLVGSDRGSNHGAGNTSSTAESHLARNINVGNLIYLVNLGSRRRLLAYSTHVLILSQKRQVKHDSKRASIRGHDDKFTSTPVKGLGALVSALRGRLA
jgi:hypothetical protein